MDRKRRSPIFKFNVGMCTIIKEVYKIKPWLGTLIGVVVYVF